MKLETKRIPWNWVQENLIGWRRTREDLLGGAGVGETVAGCVDVKGVGKIDFEVGAEVVEGEVDWAGIGFKNFRLRQ